MHVTFPFHGLPPPLQLCDLGSIALRMGGQDRKAAYLIFGHWHRPNSGHHHIPLAPCKIHSLSVHVNSFFVNSCYSASCSIDLTPQIIFPLMLNLPEAHIRSPYSSALPPNTLWSLGNKNPTNGFAFMGGEIHTSFPSQMHQGNDHVQLLHCVHFTCSVCWPSCW